MSKVHFGLLVFLICVAYTHAGGFHHSPWGQMNYGYGQGFQGSSLHNFYPGGGGNLRYPGNMGSYQYFQYDSSPNGMLDTYPQGGNIWNQMGGGSDWNYNGGNWNQPQFNSLSNWNGDLGWNNGGNNNWNIGMNNGMNSNWNSGMNSGWNNGMNSGWNNGMNSGMNNNWNNGMNNNWNNNGFNNGLNNNWNNGWVQKDGLALQSH